MRSKILETLLGKLDKYLSMTSMKLPLIRKKSFGLPKMACGKKL
ncbi:hypothetical protein HC081234_21530 [Helicobacter cinaedi]|nr:hypothetical protein HC081234_21530 [Helicobacter cinaedi]